MLELRAAMSSEFRRPRSKPTLGQGWAWRETYYSPPHIARVSTPPCKKPYPSVAKSSTRPSEDTVHAEFIRQAAQDHIQLLQKESLLRKLLKKGI